MKNKQAFTLAEGATHVSMPPVIHRRSWIDVISTKFYSIKPHPAEGSKAGFTLAEVLITLGIIGIVAAMTIPNLIQKNYEHQTVAKLKETHSILSQAIRMASEEYGEPSGWDIFGASEENAIKFMNNIKPFIKITTDCGTYDEEGKCMTKGPIYQMNQKTIWSNSYAKARGYYKFCLMNGSCLWFRTARQNEYVDSKGYIGTFFIDTNGSKQPNAFGWDVFTFNIQNDVLIPEGCDKNFNDYKISCKNKNSVGNGCACYMNLNNNMNYLHTK